MSSVCLCHVLFAAARLATAVHVRDRPRLGEEAHSRFASFVQDFGRTYTPGSEEYARRFAAFALEAAAVDEHNAKPGVTWTAAVNHLSDWYDEELEMLRGVRGARHATRGARYFTDEPVSLLSGTAVANATRLKLPDSRSWANLAAFGRVVDQGRCGSCWAISAATVLHAHSEIVGAGRAFSFEQMVKCVENPDECGGQGGCQGATPELAFDYALTTSAMLTPEAWGPEPTKFTCPVPADIHTSMHLGDAVVATSFGLKGWQTLEANRYIPILLALQEGPVTVSVWADPWRRYSHGIVDHPAPDTKVILNHAVVLHGYGSQEGKMYWQITNSWGPDWGEHGSMRLARKEELDEEKTCYTDDQPLLGTGCARGVHKSPPKVTVCGNHGILYGVTTVHFVAPPTTNQEARSCSTKSSFEIVLIAVVLLTEISAVFRPS